MAIQPFNPVNKTIVFVDPAVSGYASLVQGIPPDVDTVILNPAQDGVKQITAVLKDRAGIDSVQILSHGAAGDLQLGSTYLNLENFDRYSKSLQQWRTALSDNADILLYGCSVAAPQASLLHRGSTDGKDISFIKRLSQLTKADVAASNNPTGAGNDWNLEVRTGAIESSPALQPQSMAAYQGTLAIPSATIENAAVAEGNSNNTSGRDPLAWPFASNSIWNMPIGANAQYEDVDIGSRGVGVDTDWFIVTKESDPLVPTYLPPTFGEGRASGTTPQPQAQWHPELGEPIHVPSDLIIPDAVTSGGSYFTPNNSSAFLSPDGKTLDQFNVTARTQADAPLYGYRVGKQDIYGNGTYGGHLGSGMSSIGGSIRKGELLNDQPIHHALKLDIWGKYLHYDSSDPTPGYRWPAALADGGAPSQYQGANPALEMGSLLAIPPSVTAESLGLTTTAGKKLFQALQNYGGYIVDDSGFDYNYLCVEHDAEQEYKATTGHAISDDAGLNTDFNKLIGAVAVVNNNGSTSVGGGGTPRRPLARGLNVLNAASSTAANVIFTVKLSAPSSKPVTVKYATSNGTAIAGSDYTAVSGTLTFAPGKTSKTIKVPVKGDRTAESNETFFINLSAPSNVQLANKRGVGTIKNDDGQLSSRRILSAQADHSLGISAKDVLLGENSRPLVSSSGADILTGKQGVDHFVYSGATQLDSFSHSRVDAPDHLIHFDARQGDRIQLDYDHNLMTAERPQALFNAGEVTGTTIAAAVKAAYADKNEQAKNKQRMQANEAVFFEWQNQTYLVVNDNNRSFGGAHDLVMNVTGMNMAQHDANRGVLVVNNYFV
jgi:hypothetical protein